MSYNEDRPLLLNERHNHRHFTWDEANRKTDQPVSIVIDKAEEKDRSNKQTTSNQPINQSNKQSNDVFKQSNQHTNDQSNKWSTYQIDQSINESPEDQVEQSIYSKPLHHSVSFVEPLPHYTPSHALYRSFDETSGRRPVVPLCIPSIVPVMEDPVAEQQQEWRLNRWRALHELHISSLDSELNHRALLLIDSLVLLSLAVILMVMSRDTLAKVDAGLMLLVMFHCYIVSQWRIHHLTMLLWISSGIMLLLHLTYMVYSVASQRLRLSKHPGMIAIQLGISASLFLMFLLSLDLFKIESRTDEWQEEEKAVDAMSDFGSRKEHEAVEQIEMKLRDAVPLA